MDLAAIGAGLSLLIGVIAVLMFLGTVVIFLRGSKDKGTIATLKENNEALTKRVDLLEGSEARLAARVESLEQENAILRQHRPSAEAIAALAAQLGRHDTASRRMVAELKTLIGSLGEEAHDG